MTRAQRAPRWAPLTGLLCILWGASGCVEDLVSGCKSDADCTGLPPFATCNLRARMCQPLWAQHTAPARRLVAFAVNDERVWSLAGTPCGAEGGASAMVWATSARHHLRHGEFEFAAAVAHHPGHEPLDVAVGNGRLWALHRTCSSAETPTLVGTVDVGGAFEGTDAGPARQLAEVMGGLDDAHTFDGALWASRFLGDFGEVLVLSEDGVLAHSVCRPSTTGSLRAFRVGSRGVLWADGGGVNLSPPDRASTCVGRTSLPFTRIRPLDGTRLVVGVATQDEHLAWATQPLFAGSDGPQVERVTMENPGRVETHEARGPTSALVADADGLFWMEDTGESNAEARVMSWDWNEPKPVELGTLGGGARRDVLRTNASRVFWMQDSNRVEPKTGKVVVSFMKRQAYASPP
jgi:hypothetical protein